MHLSHSPARETFRVMAEGPDLAELQEITGEICSAVKRALR